MPWHYLPTRNMDKRRQNPFLLSDRLINEYNLIHKPLSLVEKRQKFIHNCSIKLMTNHPTISNSNALLMSELLFNPNSKPSEGLIILCKKTIKAEACKDRLLTGILTNNRVSSTLDSATVPFDKAWLWQTGVLTAVHLSQSNDTWRFDDPNFYI